MPLALPPTSRGAIGRTGVTSLLLLVALLLAPMPSARAADEPVLPRISGTVTGEGQPVVDINVVAYDDQGKFVVNHWTGEDGTYELAVPPGKTYRIRFEDAERHNFRTEYWDDQPTLAAATPILVGTDDVSGKNADLTRNPSIRGSVTTENQDEIDGARIEVYRLVGGAYEQVSDFYSGIDGRYRAPVEAGGTYKLKIVNSGDRTEWFDDVATEAEAVAIPMTTFSVTGKNVRLDALPAITGIVTTSSGPVAWARVTAYKKSSFNYWQSVDTTSTGQDGSYALGLEPGEYRLGFEHSSYGREYFDDSPTLEGSATVLLGPDGLTANATLAVPGTLHGTVRSDVDSAPLPGVTVAAERRTTEFGMTYWQPLAEVTTATDGSYGLPAIPGTYRLRFDKGLAYRSEYHANATEADLATSVIVGSSGLTVDASLAPNPTVRGTVTKPGGAGLAGIEVSLLAEFPKHAGTYWRTVSSGRTSIDGGYSLDAPVGSYRLRFRDDKNGVYRTEYFADSPTGTGATLLQLGEGGLASKDAELIAQTAVSGTVTGPAGAAPGVRVTAYELYEDNGIDDTVGVAATAITSATGAYSLALEDGVYRLKFSTDDLSLWPEFWDDASSFAKAREVVVDGVALTGRDAELEVGSGVTGTVSMPGDNPRSYVLVYTQDPDGSWRFFDEAIPKNGTFDMPLPPGTYRVKYDGDGFKPVYLGGSATFSGSTEVVITPGVVQHLGDVSFGEGSAVTNTVAPSVSGMSAVGSTLSVADGTWGPAGVELSRQWLRDGEPIAGATGPTYSLVADDLGARIAVQVRGSRTDLLSRSKTSAPTAQVVAGPSLAPPVVGPPAPVVKKAASVTVSAKGGKKKATLTITVKASGVKPTGKITIKLGGKKLKTVTLKNGKATVTLTKQKKGKRAYTVTYAGDSLVNAKSVTSKKVAIK